MTNWMTRIVQRHLNEAIVGAGLLALSAAAASGCADHVQSEVVACPCNTGICCASGVCAANENACEQATQGLSAESTGHWTGYV